MTPEEEEVKTKEVMQEIGKVFQKFFPEMGFVFMLFEMNKAGQMNYISNCQREDVIQALEEFIAKTRDSWAKDRVEGTFGTGAKQ
jgi:hypothetical protein